MQWFVSATNCLAATLQDKLPEPLHSLRHTLQWLKLFRDRVESSSTDSTGSVAQFQYPHLQLVSQFSTKWLILRCTKSAKQKAFQYISDKVYKRIRCTACMNIHPVIHRNPLARREGRRPEGEGTNIDRHLVPYHGKCKANQISHRVYHDYYVRVLLLNPK